MAYYLSVIQSMIKPWGKVIITNCNKSKLNIYDKGLKTYFINRCKSFCCYVCRADTEFVKLTPSAGIRASSQPTFNVEDSLSINSAITYETINN